MKTSNKLLTGLLIVLFLTAIGFVLIIKKSLNEEKRPLPELKEESSLNFYEKKADAGRLLHFPIALLQHSLLKGGR
ncbi:hypothetical protein [Nafulsella turpanensis]|uniref:hypothetical protein n=1 Tax=Nafulsella turpanensis TaxID=1265690 RepID=UPI00037E551B|nr:hypothetical protein [Nafulsella turpanensis]